jgi:hypothetical protein
MRQLANLCGVLLMAIVPAVSVAQDGTVKKDPEAEAILRRAYLVMGGPTLEVVQDTYAELSVKSPEGDSLSNTSVVLKTLGKKAWRTEAATPDGMSVTVVNGLDARSQVGSEEARAFPTASVAEAGNWMIPALSIIGEWGDPEIQLEYLGLQENGTVHHVRMHRLPQEGGWAAVYSPCDIFLDAVTGLPVRIAYSLHPPANLRVDIPVEVKYQDYKNISGILIPYHVTYSIRGRLVSEFHTTRFAINQGVSAFDFKVR